MSPPHCDGAAQKEPQCNPTRPPHVLGFKLMFRVLGWAHGLVTTQQI